METSPTIAAANPGNPHLTAELASLHVQYTKQKDNDKIGFPKFPRPGSEASDWFYTSIAGIADAGPNAETVFELASDMRRLSTDELR